MSALELPGQLVEFVEDATVAIVGTRGADLVPQVRRPSGFRVGEDRSSIVCYFPDAFADGLPEALEDNGEIAFTVSRAPSHETYQIKGKWIDSGPLDEDDRRAWEANVERAVPRLAGLFGFPERTIRDNSPEPSLRVRFEVREVFDQTPGPGAGRRILPEEA